MRASAGPDAAAAGVLTLLATALLLPNLGNQYLWQDEAQTALIARTILSEGVPRGTDGRNFFSQELGIEYGENYIWKWHTWGSFYLVAASFAVAGVGTGSARLPFALLGIAAVPLAYAAALRLWRDRHAAVASALLLALCVPFLLLSRQCRWYSAASVLTLAGLHAYAGLARGGRAQAVWLAVSATLLFHVHYLYCATLLAALLAHAAWLERARLRSTLAVCVGVALLNLPWILWLATIPYGRNYAERLLDPARAGLYAWALAAKLPYVLPPFLLAIPLGLAAERRWRARERPALPAGSGSGLALLALLTGITWLALALLAPGPHFRYWAPLLPALVLVAGLAVGALAHRSRALAAAAVAAWAWVGALPDYLYEITHDFDGPIEGIVRFLEERAQPGDVVAITYGDMPLKFYTGLRVVGGPTGEDLAEVADAHWIVPRRHVTRSGPFPAVRKALVAQLSPERYDRYVIDYPDTAFENRETPELHRFRTDRDEERVVIFGRRR